MKLALFGATGRMGQSIVRAARAAADVHIVGAACAPNDPMLGRDVGELAGIGSIGVAAGPDPAAALLGADVAIDFSSAAAAPTVLGTCAKAGVRVVCGTTGLGAEGEHALEAAAFKVAVLWAPNMSLGVQVLAELVKSAIAKLGADFDVEVVEVHHRQKTDAPSGTALRLAKAVEEARRGVKLIHGRSGQVGARTDAEVAVLALRGGDVVGDHTVHLLGPGERLELTHRATSRELFAHGALRAARWLEGRPAGRYTLADVIG